MREGATIRTILPKTGIKEDGAFAFRVGAVENQGKRQKEWLGLVLLLILNDLLAITAGFVLAYVIRFQLRIPWFYLEDKPPLPFYLMIGAVMIPLWIVIFAVFGLYNRQNLLGGTREYSLLFNGATFAMFSLIAVNFLIPEFVFARGWLLLTWFFVFFITAVGRFCLRRYIYRLRKKGLFLSPAVIVGLNDEARVLGEQLSNQPTSGLHLVGFITGQIPSGTTIVNGLKSLGDLPDLDAIIKEYGVEEVIVTTSAVPYDEVLTLFKMYGVLDGVNLRLSSGLYEIITTGLQVQELSGVPLIKFNKLRLTGIDLVLKYLIDYASAIVALPFVILLSVFFAILIKIDSPGPVFYLRKVMGTNGKSFFAYKFRTMRVDGEQILAARPDLQAELEREHKLKDDPRVTRVGRFLRKFSLDELPQVFNILRNEMSLVGPRMISPEEMENYKQNRINLLTVKPGITGLWQVSGRSDVSYDQRVRLDMYYIRNWSIWLDLQILVRTIPAVLSRRGAY